MKLYIFSFLDLNSLNCVSQVCKEFNKMINNENLWLERYIRLWKNHPEMDPYLQLKRMSWKRFYFIRRKTERFYFSFDRHWIPNDAQVCWIPTLFSHSTQPHDFIKTSRVYSEELCWWQKKMIEICLFVLCCFVLRHFILGEISCTMKPSITHQRITTKKRNGSFF
jgi:hypothetical protein